MKELRGCPRRSKKEERESKDSTTIESNQRGGLGYNVNNVIYYAIGAEISNDGASSRRLVFINVVVFDPIASLVLVSFDE